MDGPVAPGNDGEPILIRQAKGRACGIERLHAN
jgi:hypothetical protein